MSLIDTLARLIPDVAGPKSKKLGFGLKLKWTLAMLVLFFGLGQIKLYGLAASQLAQLEFLSVILAAQFGSVISLGIGPIVTASIVLQLLNGAGITKFDNSTHEGKQKFQNTQKVLAIAFIVLEAIVYVMFGGLSPEAGVSPLVLIVQLILGGLIIFFMDQVVSKWGFGSGISLFIAAGVSQQIFVQLFSPLTEGNDYAIGKVIALIQSIATNPNQQVFLESLAPIIATILVFGFVVYVQAMKVEIPLSFGRVRGHGIRWPLNFMYTSNIPVILVAALVANIQLLSTFIPALGDANAGTGFVSIFSVPRGGLLGEVIRTGTLPADAWTSIIYLLVFMGGSLLFSLFWVQTSGLDAKSQAKQMMASGFQVPGFRRDVRVLEKLLSRYIMPLTVMGGLTVGFLAATADLLGAIGSGTGLLLTVMIIYKLYEEIAQQHMTDMNPAMRKFLE